MSSIVTGVAHAGMCLTPEAPSEMPVRQRSRAAASAICAGSCP